MIKLGNISFTKVYKGATEFAKAYVGSTLVYDNGSQPQPEPSVPDTVRFKSLTGESTISLAHLGSSYSLSATTDGVNWELMTGSSSYTLQAGKSVWIKGSGSNREASYTQFAITGGVSLSGDVSCFTAKSSSPTSLSFFHFFEGCDIIDARDLTFGENYVNQQAFNQMFKSCTKMVYGPRTLPKTTSSMANCFDKMFQYCSSMVESPFMPGTAIPQYGASRMYEGCTSLSKIVCLATSFGSNATTNWVSNVAATGTFYKDSGTTWSTGVSGIPTGWVVRDYGVVENAVEFKSLSGASTIGLNSLSSKVYLQYSDDSGDTWNEFTTNTSLTIPYGEAVYVKGSISGDNDSHDYTNFSIVGAVSVVGSSSDLLANASGRTRAFQEMFGSCDIIEANRFIIEAESVGPHAFDKMFLNCNRLVHAPSIPNVTDSYSYANMFSGCNSLVSAPSLPATTLADNCYRNMFKNCYALTTTPELPATVGADGCYSYMFRTCTGLTQSGVIKIADPTAVVAPMEYMFSGCTNLSSVTCMATATSETATANWLADVAPTGTFYKDSGTTWPSGVSGVPTGWTQVTFEYEPVVGLKFDVSTSADCTTYDTEFTAGQIKWFEFDMKPYNKYNNGGRFIGMTSGDEEGITDNNDYRFFVASNVFYLDCGNGRSSYSIGSTNTNKRYLVRQVWTSASQYYFVAENVTGGTSYTGSSTSVSTQPYSNANFHIGISQSGDSFTFYELKLYNANNELIADYKPFKDMLTNEPVIINVLNNYVLHKAKGVYPSIVNS